MRPIGRDRMRPLPILLALVLALVSGCGGGQATSGEASSAGSAGSAGSDAASSDTSVHAGLAGTTVEPLSREELQSVMRGFNSQVKLVKLAMRSRDPAMASSALDEIAEGARRSMGTRPRKNHDQLAAYLSFLGSLRATALGLKSLVEVEAWDAMKPSLKTLSKNCMQCHTRFRLTGAEELALARKLRAEAAAREASATTTGTTASNGTGTAR